MSSDDEAVIRKTEFTSKMDAQSQSPSKRSAVKPAARQTRPTHHSCPRRRPTGDPPSSWSVSQVVLRPREPPKHPNQLVFSVPHPHFSVPLFFFLSFHHNKTLTSPQIVDVSSHFFVHVFQSYCFHLPFAFVPDAILYCFLWFDAPLRLISINPAAVSKERPSRFL